MTMAPWPVRITTDATIAAGTVVFRHGGALYVTAVVKATFALVPGGVATRIDPLPLDREERSVGPLPVMGIEAASDLAPYIPGAGVTFRGHAFAPSGRPVTAHSVRLAAYRDGAPLFEKTLHVFGALGKDGTRQPFSKMPVTYERAWGGPGTSNPAGSQTPTVVSPDDPSRPGGFSPISRHWPERKRLLAGIDREGLAKPIAELPGAMPWEYYHAAPVDQRITTIVGGEWLVLDGLHPTLPRLQTNVPVVAIAARLFETAEGAADGTPFELAADSLILDGDREVFSIVWRGRLRIAGGEAALSGLLVAAGIETPGGLIDWASLRAVAATPPVKTPAMAAGAGMEATAMISAVEMTIAAGIDRPSQPVAPFAIAEPHGPTSHAAIGASTPGAPWSGERAAPLPLPQASTMESTVALGFGGTAPARPPEPPRRAHTSPAPQNPPAPKPAPAPLAKDAAGLAARLSGAGGDDGQIRQLVAALKPALPPPEEE